jgi:ribulose-bisphosphate carboxylase large chain
VKAAPDHHITATYIATRPEREPTELAEAIAREQSLEIIPALIPKDIADAYLGRVLEISRLDDERWALTIAYPAILASDQPGQLLQLIYGNVSFYPRIRLAGLHLPETLLESFNGPRAGLAGIRELTGVPRRALLISVLKPRGSSVQHLADIAWRFASSGGDILKDDQNLVDSDIEKFSQRVRTCAEAIDRAAQTTGRRCLYLPHVAGSGRHLNRQLDIVTDAGLTGVVMCPWVMGLETAATTARDHGLLWLAHPAAAGVFTEPTDMGVAADLIFGTLPRLAGADLVIYPGTGGRISAHGNESLICQSLTAPLGHLAPSLPCTGGGKTLAQAPETAQRLGHDCAIVIGGDLLRLGDRMGTSIRKTIKQLEGSVG